mmetsp:Transcript_3271/g.5046  ORF Transcript_3271/g.5046 Transcript_3271/m.5046 type:complete len:151 (+) Transcript_3271:472-924(+)
MCRTLDAFAIFFHVVIVVTYTPTTELRSSLDAFTPACVWLEAAWLLELISTCSLLILTLAVAALPLARFRLPVCWPIKGLDDLCQLGCCHIHCVTAKECLKPLAIVEHRGWTLRKFENGVEVHIFVKLLLGQIAHVDSCNEPGCESCVVL